MATRNLSRKFFELRNNHKANRHLMAPADEQGDDRPLVSTEERTWPGTKPVLPPIWVEAIEAIEEQMTKIQSKSTYICAHCMYE
jgi:hypothetical protein